MTRRYEMVEGASRKFWEITVQGSSLLIRFGRIGTDGQAQTKTFASPEKASEAAAKLIAEKTAKGYAEAQGAAPAAAEAKAADAPATEAPAAGAKAAGAKAGKAAGAEARGKPAAKKLEALALSGGKQAGERALANAAERLQSASTPDEWRTAVDKLPGGSWEKEKVLAHLLLQEAFLPTSRLHAAALSGLLHLLPPGAALRLLSQLPEAAVETLPTGQPSLLRFTPVVLWLQQTDPDAFRATTLPPTLARVGLLARALAGETLGEAEADDAIAAASDLLRYGDTAIGELDENQRARPVSHEQLAQTFARLKGPRWVTTFPDPERLPTATAIEGLAGESLDEAARVVGLFNKKLLGPRTEPPARFFEVAARHTGQKAEYLRVAGVAHATSPEQIPQNAELPIEPIQVLYEPGFAHLGTARLDAWVEHWVGRFPGALTEADPEHPDASVGRTLLRLALTALPFSDAMRARLLRGPLPYHLRGVQGLDVRSWVNEITIVDQEAASDVLRVAAAQVQVLEAAGAPAERVQGHRLLAASALRRLPGGVEVPGSIDALLSLGDGVDYDSERIVREAVARLPVERAERVVMRSACELSSPYEELTYAREGFSEAMLRRLARLVVSGRESERLWLTARGKVLAPLGAPFGHALLEALGNTTLSESFLAHLGQAIHEDALAIVRAGASQLLLDLPRELDKLSREIGGERAVVYALRAGAAARSLSRVGGVPAGFAPEDIPRHRGRKMVHAFTVDLKHTPELAARYPGARTLSIWIQGYSEFSHRAQALVTRTDEQIAAHPSGGDAQALVIERLEVPAAMFKSDASERALYARGLLYKEPGFLLGGPLWLQDGPHGLDPNFVAQYDERLAPSANFGDAGICYSFADHAEWQCH